MPHPGVTLTYRSAMHPYWRGRWRDPLTGKRREKNLTRLGLTTHALRRKWATRKSRELQLALAQIATGQLAREGESLTLAAALGRYLGDVGARLEPRTADAYRVAVVTFHLWCRGKRLERTAELTKAQLFAYRATLAGSGLASSTVDTRLRRTRTALHWLRKADLVRLSGDEIKVGLEGVSVPRPQPRFLSRAELRRLFDACAAHDETAGVSQGRPGRPPALASDAVEFLLFTGCRQMEGLTVRVDQVDLEAEPAGEIRILAEDTKTKIGRTLDLVVSVRLQKLVAKLVREAEAPYLFGGAAPWGPGKMRGIRRRLERFGAPVFTCQDLRRTCASYLTNAPGIFGSASAFRSARQLGHSVVIAERHYVDAVRGIPAGAKTLEAAMGLEG